MLLRIGEKAEFNFRPQSPLLQPWERSEKQTSRILLALKYVSDRKIEPLCRPQQEMSKKCFSVARCLLALDVQKSKNFSSENDTSLSHLQEVHKGNKSLAISKAVHLKHNSSQLPAKSPIAEANTVSHGRLRLCNRRYAGANSSWRWNARDTRGEEHFRFQVIFLFRSSRSSLRCRLELVPSIMLVK